MTTIGIVDPIEALFSLHLEILKRLLQGKSFKWIQNEYYDILSQTDYLDIMIKSGNLSFNSKDELIGAYPISPIPTNHRIEVVGIGSGYAMCAIDALGVAYTFGAKTIIDSQVLDTKSPIRIIIDPSLETQTPLDIVITYKQLILSQKSEDAPAVVQCPVINFYSNPEAVPKSDPLLEILTFEEAVTYAADRFSPKGIKKLIKISIIT